jgi:hypothetical protein
MKQVGSADVLARIQDRVGRGYHVDGRLIREVNAPGELYQFWIEEEDDFLRLIWQVSNPTRLLTPGGQPRTLRDVVTRMVSRGWTFASLLSPIGLPAALHEPSAFEKFDKLFTEFDFEAFGFLGVTPALPSELTESPRGTFYIYDGVHRSLALAYRLVAHLTDFQPVECLLLVPRRH